MRKSSFIATALCVAIANPTARATLVPYEHNGVQLVYSSVSNITWLQNGNLLNNLFIDRGIPAVYNDIAAAVPTVTLTYSFSGPQPHTVALTDYLDWWEPNGRANFYGAYAFVQYLNAISYGGVNQWRLPDAINGVYPNPFPSGYVKSGDFGQLYYDELNSPSGFGMADPLNYFSNEVGAQYWSATDADFNVTQPFGFNVGQGDQYFLNRDFPFFVWPVFSGQVSAIPEASAALFMIPAALLAGFAAIRRRMTPSRG